MINFQYQIIRYRHDLTTGEFINVGLVFYIPSKKQLEVLVTNKYKRISDFYFGVSGAVVRGSLKSLERKIKNYAKSLSDKLDFNNHEQLESILFSLYPKDEGAIQFSSLYTGTTPDLHIKEIFSDLFIRLVDKYTHHHERASRSDEDAKKIIYRGYFDKLNITPKLIEKEIKTNNDSFKFEGLKNGKWNYYKPISFDLLDKDSIKDKVYKWVGITSELATSKESFALYFLSLDPKVANGDEIKSFIKKKLELKSDAREIHVIEEERISDFVENIPKEMHL